MLNFSNFVRTTLRAPVTPSDTTLLLETGSGALFNVPSGDYFYVTVNDGSTVEVMKYTSIGPVISDTIPVERGKDGTTAKAFPVGACVQVAWNKAQVADFITQVYNDLFDAALLGSDTIEVDETPTAAPPGGVYYAVRVATHQFWYWDINSPGWIEIGNIGNGIMVTTVPPTGVPLPNMKFAVNLSDAGFWYWTGTEWIQLSGNDSGSGQEVWARRTVTGTTVMHPGASLSSSGFTWEDNVRWQANPALASILSVNGLGQYVISHDCIMAAGVAINAQRPLPVTNCAGTLVMTSTDPDLFLGEWGNSFNFDTGQSQPAVIMSAQTSLIKMSAGSVIDMNLIYDASSVGDLTVNRIFFSIDVRTLL